MHVLVSKLLIATSNYRLSKRVLKIREKAKGPWYKGKIEGFENKLLIIMIHTIRKTLQRATE